jgi:ribose transport system permease protein
MTATTISARSRPLDDIGAVARRMTWTLALVALLVILFAVTKLINPSYGPAGIQGLGISVLPLVFAAVGQAIVVIAGGIDLSLGSMMAFTSVVAATLMVDNTTNEFGIGVVLGVLVLGLVLGAINGTLVVLTRVPDIVVTLAMSFVWAGCALLVRSDPGGGAAPFLIQAVNGRFFNEWVPKALIVIIVIVGLIWLPMSRSRLGISMYAIGSNQLAAFRSGVAVGRTKIAAYILTGFFAGLGGLSLTAITGIGDPRVGPYTLESVAAIVLGGVSLAGGRGGVTGPILAVIVLQLIQADLTFLRFDSNYSFVAQGVIVIAVVVVGSLIQLRRERA